MPDYTGGSFSAEDLFTVVSDAILQEVTGIDSSLYPLIHYCGDGVLDNSGCGTGPNGTDVFPARSATTATEKAVTAATVIARSRAAATVPRAHPMSATTEIWTRATAATTFA